MYSSTRVHRVVPVSKKSVSLESISPSHPISAAVAPQERLGCSTRRRRRHRRCPMLLRRARSWRSCAGSPWSCWSRWSGARVTRRPERRAVRTRGALSVYRMSPKALIETGPLTDEPPPMAVAHAVVSPSPSASRQRFISMAMLAAEVAWLLVQSLFMILDAVYHAIKPNEGKDLTGKLVLITGAGHGLGKETALQFARQGCRVVCVDVNKVGNEETVREILLEAEKAGVPANGKPRAKGYVCNVADRKKIQELAVQVTKDMGDVDILVNNAGILTEHSFRDATPEEIDLTINVNFTSHFWTIQSFLPGMLKRNSGHIVAIASVGSFIGVANFSTYCATKYAVDGLMSSLHEEFRAKQKDIKLTTVHPYFINTRPDLIKGWHHRLPLITPDRVAAAVVRGVRRESISVTIPKFLFYLIAISRFFPQNVIDIWRDVFYTHITPPNKIAPSPAAPAAANGTASANGVSVACNGAANGAAIEVKKDL